jgi:hypothetical protein
MVPSQMFFVRPRHFQNIHNIISIFFFARIAKRVGISRQLDFCSVLKTCLLSDVINWTVLRNLLNPFLLYRTLSRVLFFRLNHLTDGRTPWTSDQLVARQLPKDRATRTQNKHIHIPNIYALFEIRTHDPGFRASEDSACLSPLGFLWPALRIFRMRHFHGFNILIIF